ncbi:MAG: thiol:disulfide interchange protein DsbA/DsbL [Gammaproteobacteria bacterium]|nr:thiol:disulfide interchange protein DsbA/DsbL [Gammaproteobacteria bacterium]
MKNLKWIGPLLLVVFALGAYGCSKEEAPVAPAEEAATATEQAVEESMDAAVEQAEQTADEVLEVVEESAAEAEPADETIKLALAEPPAAAREWQFKEGTHYVRMVPTQPTVGSADKIEVAEFFWYGCPHCYDMEPFINEWAENKDPGVRFVKVPATWNALVRLHAQLYYTEEVLVRNEVIKDPAGFREAVFQEYHRRGNRMTSEDAIMKIFARFGVSEEQFASTWGSFEVNQKLRVADDLSRRYSISSVPAIVVNGKYRTGAGEAGGYPKLMELIDELVAREGLR